MEETGASFPPTQWTLLRRASDPAAPEYRECLDRFAALYWRPVYAHFRRKWSRSREEAQDLTQEFFVALAEKDFLSRITPEKGRFRSYVRAALDNFARLDHRERSALKRGGQAGHVSIDFDAGFEPADEGPADDVFEREWAAAILDEALGRLEEECRARGAEKGFQVLTACYLDSLDDREPGYEELATRFKITPTDVRNHLYRLRKRLREIVMEHVRETVASSEDAEAEMRELFGSLVK